MSKDYTLNCSATGNPTPSVWWEWYACTDGDDKCEPPDPNAAPGTMHEWKRLSTQELGSAGSSDGTGDGDIDGTGDGDIGRLAAREGYSG